MKSWRSFLNSQPIDRANLNLPPMSLMWPGAKPLLNPPTMPWQADLGVREVIHRLPVDRRYADFLYETLVELNTNLEVIQGRQSVLADFVRNPEMVNALEALLPRLAGLRMGTNLLGNRKRNLLLETSDRLSELENYTTIMVDLHTILSAASLESEAMQVFREQVMALVSDVQFQQLRTELPEMRAPLQNVHSLTIGINLDSEMRPLSAVLLDVNDFTLDERVSWLERLIGLRHERSQESGIASLHHLPKDPDLRMFSEFFQDLDRLMVQVAQPISRELNRYTRTSSSTLMSLEFELGFFIAGCRLVQAYQQAGVEYCQPESAALEARLTELDDLVNVALLLRKPEPGVPEAVPSDVRFDADGRIAILTGPNSGGKTTYIQGVGLAQMLFQAGWYIPAKRAVMSPVDAILTHYPQLETRQQGRLAEESERLRVIFQKATAYSLVLLNETFSSTASGEAVYLAQDILCALRAIGVRAVYATHFIELVDLIEEIEQSIEGDSRLCSLVAGVRLLDDAQAVPTYKVTRGLPLGRSYAQEIARRHGISLAQILAARQDGNGAAD
ncbi:MAG: hypothetical protein OHK0046_04650 [Anaerolineae bacterium]